MMNESDSLLRANEEDRSLPRRRTASLLIPGFIVSVVLVAASVSPEARFFFSKHITDSIVDAEDNVASPAPRYKATQFISFTINTLGGLISQRRERHMWEDVPKKPRAYIYK
jgi:hypothetical protein